MIDEYISAEIAKQLGVPPTESQQQIINALAQFMASPSPNSCILIKGYAGTGKTTLIAAYVKTLKMLGNKFMLLAPTGRAAKVLGEYSGESAYTIHKCIYRQKSASDGVGQFSLDFNKHQNTIFIVDEASMLSNYSSDDSAFGSGYLLSDLIEYVSQGNGCRLIFVGDTAQLPPIGTQLSPALNARELSHFDLQVSEFTLTEVIRQGKDSGILHNATLLRQIIDSNQVETPRFITEGFDDIKRISGADLLEHLADDYSRYGKEDNVVICYSNKRANIYNNGIRARIFYSDEELSVGDFLMVARNSYFWTDRIEELAFIANGEIVEVRRIGKRYEMYGFRFADVTLRLIDSNDYEIDMRIILDTLAVEGPSLNADATKALYQKVAEDYAHIRTKKERLQKIKDDPFFNAVQVKFAYAVTCHKAQGGQWKNVFVDQGFFRPEMLNREYLRWLYTAITRASGKLYLVNFSKDFFPEGENGT